MTDIVLLTQTEDPFLALRGLHLQSDGANYQSFLEVRSRGLSCGVVFYFEPYVLKQFIDGLASMVRTLKGSARLGPEFEDEYVEVDVDHLGHVNVRGEVFEHSERPQHLRFEFQTDQTVLEPLLRELRRCRQAETGAPDGRV